MITRIIAAAVAGTMAVLGLAGCASEPDRLTLRLWDPQVAEAYRDSLAQFEDESGIEVDVVVVPWADYFTQLRADLAAGRADDVFWTNATDFRQYAAQGVIEPVSADLLEMHGDDWEPAVVAQYTVEGTLWGVPQITDPGIAVLYNAELLAAAGVDETDLDNLSWDPAAADDSLRSLARRLTADSAGRHPGDPGFDDSRTVVYGFGAANDLNAVLLQFLAGNGATWQTGDEFTFASDEGIAALGYVADLINREHVAPHAANTNPPAGGDFLLDQFTRGQLALFPTGAYNLANVLEGADFEWGVAPLPIGPAGRISVTNGVVLAAAADSEHPDEVRSLLSWLGSPEGQGPIGESGTALPAARTAQDAYLDFWSSRSIDIAPMLDVLGNGSIQAPQGSRYPAAAAAMAPLLEEFFLGVRPAAPALRAAQDAANAAIDP